MSKYFSEEEKASNSAFKEKSIADKNIFEKISLYYNIIKDKTIIYIFERWILTFQTSMRISMKIIVLDLKPATLYYSCTFRFLKGFHDYKNAFYFKYS